MCKEIFFDTNEEHEPTQADLKDVSSGFLLIGLNFRSSAICLSKRKKLTLAQMKNEASFPMWTSLECFFHNFVLALHLIRSLKLEAGEYIIIFIFPSENMWKQVPPFPISLRNFPSIKFFLSHILLSL